ncbi:MAG: DUF4292 domain-containing protein [Deltaproteobacteria bacterium]|nr:DUF4292 domain-containing protein [Deltaproteobacteria bacterium]
MNWRTWCSRSLCLLCLSALLGCAPQGTTAHRPVRGGKGAPGLQGAASRLEARDSQLQETGILGTFKNGWSVPYGDWNFAAVVAGMHRVRLDLFDPLAGSIGTLILNGKTVWWYAPMAGQAYRMPADAAHVERLLRIPLAPTDLANLLRGLPLGEDTTWVKWPAESAHVLRSPDQRMRLEFDPDSGMLRRCQRLGRGSRVELEVEYSEYRTVKGVALPHHVTIQDPRNSRRAVLNLTEVTPHARLKGDPFTLELDGSVEVHEWP